MRCRAARGTGDRLRDRESTGAGGFRTSVHTETPLSGEEMACDDWADERRVDVDRLLTLNLLADSIDSPLAVPLLLAASKFTIVPVLLLGKGSM